MTVFSLNLAVIQSASMCILANILTSFFLSTAAVSFQVSSNLCRFFLTGHLQFVLGQPLSLFNSEPFIFHRTFFI